MYKVKYEHHMKRKIGLVMRRKRVENKKYNIKALVVMLGRADLCRFVRVKRLTQNHRSSEIHQVRGHHDTRHPQYSWEGLGENRRHRKR